MLKGTLILALLILGIPSYIKAAELSTDCIMENDDFGNICCIKNMRINPESQIRTCCPDNGVLVSIGWGGEICCKDKYELDEETGLYTYPSGWCGCLDGGEKVWSASDLLYICCKDGYRISHKTRKYDLVDAWCGCPNGGRPIPHTSECIKDGKIYSNETNQYDKPLPNDFSFCDLEGGLGYLSEINSNICCQNGMAHTDSLHGYRTLFPKYCGCPDGFLNIGNYCCGEEDFYKLDGVEFPYEWYSDKEPNKTKCIEKTGYVNHYTQNGFLSAKIKYEKGIIEEVKCINPEILNQEACLNYLVNEKGYVIKSTEAKKHNTKEGPEYFNEGKKAFLNVYSFLLIAGGIVLLLLKKRNRKNL